MSAEDKPHLYYSPMWQEWLWLNPKSGRELTNEEILALMFWADAAR